MFFWIILSSMAECACRYVPVPLPPSPPSLSGLNLLGGTITFRMKNYEIPYVSVWLDSEWQNLPNIRPRSLCSSFHNFFRWSSTSIGEMYFWAVPSLYSSSLDSSSLCSLSTCTSVYISDTSSLPDYFLLVVCAVVSLPCSVFSSPLLFDDSTLSRPYLIFYAYLYAMALLAANGLTNSFVYPSLLTAGDFFLQWGQVVVITCDHMSFIRVWIRFWAVVFGCSGALPVIARAICSSYCCWWLSIFSTTLLSILVKKEGRSSLSIASREAELGG